MNCTEARRFRISMLRVPGRRDEARSIALIDKDMPVVALAKIPGTTDDQQIEQARSRGGPVMAVATDEREDPAASGSLGVPETPWLLSP
jgi:glucosamine 6-phosphate synthetase-like amidotransferase/phosphosugar isomerase protein